MLDMVGKAPRVCRGVPWGKPWAKPWGAMGLATGLSRQAMGLSSQAMGLAMGLSRQAMGRASGAVKAWPVGTVLLSYSTNTLCGSTSCTDFGQVLVGNLGQEIVEGDVV